MELIENESQLEERLSRPIPALVEAMSRLEGDLLILGGGGKMGPSLARLARRALDEAGGGRRVVAASIFESEQTRLELEREGVEAGSCNLLDGEEIQRVARCRDIIYMAGRKFGSTDRPDLTWVINVLLPAAVLQHFRESRIVAFSTGTSIPS